MDADHPPARRLALPVRGPGWCGPIHWFYSSSGFNFGSGRARSSRIGFYAMVQAETSIAGNTASQSTRSLHAPQRHRNGAVRLRPFASTALIPLRRPCPTRRHQHCNTFYHPSPRDDEVCTEQDDPIFRRNLRSSQARSTYSLFSRESSASTRPLFPPRLTTGRKSRANTNIARGFDPGRWRVAASGEAVWPAYRTCAARAGGRDNDYRSLATAIRLEDTARSSIVVLAFSQISNANPQTRS